MKIPVATPRLPVLVRLRAGLGNASFGSAFPSVREWLIDRQHTVDHLVSRPVFQASASNERAEVQRCNQALDSLHRIRGGGKLPARHRPVKDGPYQAKAPPPERLPGGDHMRMLRQAEGKHGS